MNSLDLQAHMLPFSDGSTDLDALLREKCQKQGNLTFAEWMAACLYTPELGYYTRPHLPFGPDGDFMTAPEYGALLAGCLARQCAAYLQDYPESILVEMGPGSGRMAGQLITALANLQALPRQYCLVEWNPHLMQYQKQQLQQQLPPDLFACLEWRTAPPQEKWQGILLANEILDACPIELFQIEDGKIQQGFVGLSAQNSWELFFANPVSNNFANKIQSLGVDFPAHYCSEINLNLDEWFQSWDRHWQAGFALLIDYGFPRHEYYHWERNQGTLTCFYQHRSDLDPLENRGLQDITAHVDFTAVAEAAHARDLQVLGFVNQADFMLNAGLDQVLQQLTQNNNDADTTYRLAQETKRLTMPGEMGDLFKVLLVAKTEMQQKYSSGFLTHNRLDRLERLVKE